MTSLLLKRIIEECGTCNPCSGSGSSSSGSHGNPGCCADTFSGCATCYRLDLSYLLSGCAALPGCISDTGYLEETSGCGGGYSQSSNIDDAISYLGETSLCNADGDTPDVSGLTCNPGGWTVASFSLGPIMCVSNMDPVTGIQINKNNDGVLVIAGFTCFEGSTALCAERVRFCARVQFVEGHSFINPAPRNNPGWNAYFHQDIGDFTNASCDPFLFEVSDLAPWSYAEFNGLDGATVIPLTKPCPGIKISASYTGECA